MYSKQAQTNKRKKQLVELQDRIRKFSSQPQIRQCLSQISKLIKQFHIGYILSLFNNQSLLILLQNCQKIYLQKKDKTLLQNIYPIFQIVVECQLDYDLRYKQAFKGYKTRWTQKCFLKNYLHASSLKSYEQRKKLIKQFLQIKLSNEQPYGKGQKLKKYIQQLNKPKKYISQHLYDQAILNWLNQQVNSYIKNVEQQIKMPKFGYCCSPNFQHSNIAKSIQFPGHHYVGLTYFDPQFIQGSQYRSFGLEVKKKVVQYLNCKGGYILFGVSRDPNTKKQGCFYGIALSQQKRYQFLIYLLNDIVLNIFPQDNCNQYQTQAQTNAKLAIYKKQKQQQFKQQVQTQLSHRLSNCLSVEFVPMYDKNLFNVINELNQPRYIVRLQVTVGLPQQLYFILNQKQIPQAYTGTRQPLPINLYYDQVYKKLKDKADGKLTEKQPYSHPFCLHSLKYNPITE